MRWTWLAVVVLACGGDQDAAATKGEGRGTQTSPGPSSDTSTAVGTTPGDTAPTASTGPTGPTGLRVDSSPVDSTPSLDTGYPVPAGDGFAMTQPAGYSPTCIGWVDATTWVYREVFCAPVGVDGEQGSIAKLSDVHVIDGARVVAVTTGRAVEATPWGDLDAISGYEAHVVDLDAGTAVTLGLAPSVHQTDHPDGRALKGIVPLTATSAVLHEDRKLTPTQFAEQVSLWEVGQPPVTWVEGLQGADEPHLFGMHEGSVLAVVAGRVGWFDGTGVWAPLPGSSSPGAVLGPGGRVYYEAWPDPTTSQWALWHDGNVSRTQGAVAPYVIKGPPLVDRAITQAGRVLSINESGDVTGWSGVDGAAADTLAFRAVQGVRSLQAHPSDDVLITASLLGPNRIGTQLSEVDCAAGEPMADAIWTHHGARMVLRTETGEVLACRPDGTVRESLALEGWLVPMVGGGDR